MMGDLVVQQPGDAEMTEVIFVDCPRCGQHKQAHHIDKHLCIDCVHAEDTRLTYYRQHQDDWIANAKENGLELWVQQPGETQWEYTVWTAYRDSYPGKKPSYGDVARQLNTTYNSVRKIAQRWSFQPRMQAWMKYCDDLTLQQRRQEILDMNKDHVDMAAKLRSKLNTAIEAIDPLSLKPGEIASLAKLAAEMERKARVDTIAQEELRRDSMVDTENPDLKKSPTKQSDLSEVVGILLKAGALGDITQIGVRQTNTTEIALVDNNGNSASMTMNDE